MKIGVSYVSLVEPPLASIFVLVRWSGVKTDLTQLARLRWIEKKNVPAICQIVGLKRTAIRASIRTLRKAGISDLNLTEDEKKLVQEQMEAEERIFGGQYR